MKTGLAILILVLVLITLGWMTSETDAERARECQARGYVGYQFDKDSGTGYCLKAEPYK